MTVGVHPRVGVLVGNPKPRSRTYLAAVAVAELLRHEVAPEVVLDVVDLGADLLAGENSAVTDAVERISTVDLLVVASPTYKATYTGLLKLFLDRLPSGALDGVQAVPLMLGAGPGHALAPELLLKPVLVELGASTPTRGLYLLDREWQDSPTLTQWLPTARRQLGLAAPVLADVGAGA
jgi:FMN reductase